MLTGRFRASYAQVFTPQSMNGGEPKYSISMLIPKSDTATLNAIYAEIERVKNEAIQTTFQGKVPPQLQMPIHDGDGLRPSGEPFGEECKGHMVLRASSRNKPSVVDMNVQPIIDPNQFYSGCYARATVNFYAYNQNGNRGIGCGLNNIQKLEEGEPFSGRTTAEEDFGGSNAIPGVPQGYVNQPGYQASVQQQGYGAQPYQAPAPQQSYQPVPTNAGYAPPAQAAYQPPVQQPGYPAPGQPAVDPITGQPMTGGVMGI